MGQVVLGLLIFSVTVVDLSFSRLLPTIFLFLPGPLDIGVPGEIKGYWYAHQKYGRLPWAKLFEPAIKMARYGFPVPFGLHRAIEDGEELLCTEPSLKLVYFIYF